MAYSTWGLSESVYRARSAAAEDLDQENHTLISHQTQPSFLPVPGTVALPPLPDHRTTWFMSRHEQMSGDRSPSPVGRSNNAAKAASTAQPSGRLLSPSSSEPLLPTGTSPPRLAPPVLTISAVAISACGKDDDAPTSPRLLTRGSGDGVAPSPTKAAAIAASPGTAAGGANGKEAPRNAVSALLTCMAVVYMVLLMGAASLVFSQVNRSGTSPYGFFASLMPGHVRQHVEIRASAAQAVGGVLLMGQEQQTSVENIMLGEGGAGSGGGGGVSTAITTTSSGGDGGSAGGAVAVSQSVAKGFMGGGSGAAEEVDEEVAALRAAQAAAAVGSWHSMAMDAEVMRARSAAAAAAAAASGGGAAEAASTTVGATSTAASATELGTFNNGVVAEADGEQAAAMSGGAAARSVLRGGVVASGAEAAADEEQDEAARLESQPGTWWWRPRRALLGSSWRMRW